MRILLSFIFLCACTGGGGSNRLLVGPIPYEEEVPEVEEKVVEKIVERCPESEIDDSEPQFVEVELRDNSFESELIDTPVDKIKMQDFVTVEEEKKIQEVGAYRTVQNAKFICISDDLSQVHTFEPACGSVKYMENGRSFPAMVLLRNDLRVCRVYNSEVRVYCQFFGIPVCPKGFNPTCS